MDFDLVGGTISASSASINGEEELSVPTDDSSTPLLARRSIHPLEGPMRFVSGIASRLTDTGPSSSRSSKQYNDEDDEEDAAEVLVREMRERNKDTEVKIHAPKQVDLDYHRTARRMVCSSLACLGCFFPSVFFS